MDKMSLKTTPIHPRHLEAKAKMAPFAGYDMPIEYSGILDEHETVRNSMGLFDVSHMGEIEVRGKRALEFCQRISTNDVSSLKPGKVQYSTILNEKGGVLDDCTVYCMAEDRFLFVVNAACKDKIWNWFLNHKMDGVDLEDQSPVFGLLALQGREADRFLSEKIQRDLSTVKFYEFTHASIMGIRAMISRTGYTGEDGFELYLPWDQTLEVWDHLLLDGAPQGLKPIGLGARDTLRLEMGYLLYGQDMDEARTPLEAGLSWIVKMDKGNFIGRERLLEQKVSGPSQRLRAFEVLERGIPRSHYEITSQNESIGLVTSGTFSPTLRRGIALGYVKSGVNLGSKVFIHAKNRSMEASIVKTPFVKGSLKR